MANSGHSIGFRRLFDAAVSNVVQPLKERLTDTWQPGEAMPDANVQIASDISHIATTLHVLKNGLTWEQYAFLGDLCDRALRLLKGGTVEEFKTRLLALAGNSYYWEPPTSSLNLLRGYDAVAKTTVGNVYKDFLLKIVSVTLTYVEKPGTERDNQLIGEFDSFWTEVLTATRAPQKRLHQDSGAIISELNKAVLEFVVPARDVIRNYNQLMEMPGLKDTEAFIRRTFTNYCAQAVLADSVVEERELELFHDLAPTLMFFGRQGSLENLHEMFKGASKNISPSETPLLVSILDVYDGSMKTDLGQRARSLYFRIANTAFKADLTVNEEEVAWLEQFKNTLYPEGMRQTDTARAHGLETDGPIRITSEVTVEESLEELNGLVGLDKAKQDFNQLVNLIKVQQMRQEKGLPVAAIPRHFVFLGNPGTGKVAVGHILANVYRALAVLKKGHFVEVDKTDLVTGQTSPTAGKLQEAMAAALEGVLYIDDADALGPEAIDALVKLTEDRKENLVVIVAGYPDQLEKILNSNPDFKSRFNKVFRFEDYSPQQMLGIYELFCRRAAFQTSPSALAIVSSLLEQLYNERGEGFGNARDVRHVFECIIGNQANRIISLPQVNEEILSTIADEDVQSIISALERPADARKIPKPLISS